jgi:hypothetical protein
MCGYIETVRAIVEHSGNVQVKNGAMAAAVLNERVDLARVLLAEGTDPNLQSADGSSPPGTTYLWAAARKGAVEMIDLLLKWGADPSQTTQDGGTALMAAAANGRPETLQMLINAGADVNAADKDDQTALMHTLFMRWTECTRVLLASGADTELRDKNGGTPLMNVAATSHTSMLRLLLEWDAVHAEGFTPLMIAAFRAGSTT